MATMTSGLSDAGDKAVNADVVERVSLLVASGTFVVDPLADPSGIVRTVPSGNTRSMPVNLQGACGWVFRVAKGIGSALPRSGRVAVLALLHATSSKRTKYR